MTIHIKMLQEIALHARAMADAMQAVADDCAQQLAARRAAGETEEAMMGESFERAAEKPTEKPADQPAALKPYDGATPFDAPKEAPFDAPKEAPFDAPKEAPPAAARSDAPGVTMVELRAFVAERSTPENRARIKAILNRYGVKKLTELDESRYRAVMDEVAGL